MRDNWKICYTAISKAGEPLEESKKDRFTYANICAKTANEAIDILKSEFSMFDIKVFGKPIHSYVTDEDYDKDEIVF